MPTPPYTPNTAQNTDTSLINYPQLYQHLTAMHKLQRKIREETTALQTPLHYGYVALKRFILQQNTEEMNTLLAHLRREAERFATLQENILSQRDDNLATLLHTSHTAAKNLAEITIDQTLTQQKIKELEKTILTGTQSLKETRCTSQEYTAQNETLRDAHRTLATTKNAATTLEQALIDLHEERYFNDQQEALIRHSYATAELLLGKTKALETHITSTTFYYRACTKSHSCYPTLTTSVTRQETLLMQIADILKKSQQTAQPTPEEYAIDYPHSFLAI